MNYFHPSEARTRKNRTKVRSLVSKKQHQREKLSAAVIASSKTGRAEIKSPSAQISHVAVASLNGPVFKESSQQLGKSSLLQLPEEDRHSKDLDRADASTLSTYVRWSVSSVNLLVTRSKQLKLTLAGA